MISGMPNHHTFGYLQHLPSNFSVSNASCVAELESIIFSTSQWVQSTVARFVNTACIRDEV